MDENKIFRSKWVKYLAVGAMVVIVAFSLYLWANFESIIDRIYPKNNTQNEKINSSVKENKNVNPIASSLDDKNKNISVDNTQANSQTQDEDPNQFKSENFVMSDAQFGGDMEVGNNQSDSEPLEISGVKNESFLDKNKNESEVVISWKTNKLSMSDVVYSKNNEQNTKVYSEGDFGFNHSVVIKGLDAGVGYVYKIKSVDRWGNKYETEYFGFYSSARSQSIIELIAREINNIFGWIK